MRHDAEPSDLNSIGKPAESLADRSVELLQRLAFLELTPPDRERLAVVRDLLGPTATQFIDTFYRHLFVFDSTARFLQDPELLARLKQSQQAHLESMLAAEWNENYLQQRRRVGDAHAKLGIEPQMFLGAYNQYLQYALRELSGDSPELRACNERISSLIKAVLLDIGLTLDAYFLQATQNLRQALEMLFQANTELKHFAQLTSHDLKTPLGTVANLCEEALDEFGPQMPEGARSLIEAARQRTFRMGTLIDELLKSATTPLPSRQPERIPAGELFAEIAEQLGPQLAQKQIALVIPPDLPNLLGERVRIREVFYNVFSNAIKFMHRRAGRIEVRAEQDDAGCTLCIADNGPGIPLEEQARIFSPFTRLTEHLHVPGTGLGLYFAKMMIEEQGGRIWVESAPGQGCQFYVRVRTAS